jgi:predicted TIM-barrel fold metal-dependent hydrolase
MDADGIDAAFLYPSLGLFAGAVEDPGLAAAMCRAYNRWLADYCKPYPERLFGVAMLPMQSVELAVDEMRYARDKLGMRGGFLRPGRWPRTSISPSAFTRDRPTRCRPLASIGSRMTARRATWSRTQWR